MASRSTRLVPWRSSAVTARNRRTPASPPCGSANAGRLRLDALASAGIERIANNLVGTQKWRRRLRTRVAGMRTVSAAST